MPLLVCADTPCNRPETHDTFRKVPAEQPCPHLRCFGQRVLVKAPGRVVAVLTGARAARLHISWPSRSSLTCCRASCAIGVPVGGPPGLHKLFEQLTVVALLLLVTCGVCQGDDGGRTQQDQAPVGEVCQPLRVGPCGAVCTSLRAAAYLVVVCRAAGAGGWLWSQDQVCLLHPQGCHRARIGALL